MRGFTLIEILLVVVLLGIVAGIVVPSYHGPYKALLLKSSTDSAVSLMRYAQGQATIKHIPFQFNCAEDSRSFWITRAQTNEEGEVLGFEIIPDRLGKPVKIPPQVTVTCEQAGMTFYPDGTISKNKIKFSNKNKAFTISTYEQRGYVLVYTD